MTDSLQGRSFPGRERESGGNFQPAHRQAGQRMIAFASPIDPRLSACQTRDLKPLINAKESRGNGLLAKEQLLLRENRICKDLFGGGVALWGPVPMMDL